MNSTIVAAAPVLRRRLDLRLRGLLPPWSLHALTACLTLVLSYGIVARSCGYDHMTVALYALYVTAYVWLPGCTLLRAIRQKPASVLDMIGLGLPLGFAAEIAVYFVFSFLGVGSLLAFMPFVWGACWTFLVLKRSGVRRSRSLTPDEGAGWGSPMSWVAVGGVVLAFTITIVSHLYAAAPLVNGGIQAPTHHDWIYLLSRAAEIKQHWPLQDPSLAGERLSYHYFLLVHLASASLVTGVKLEMLGLRLFVLPLSAALIAQALCLGKLISRSVWGGVLAAALLFVAGEFSLSAPAQGSLFGNDFVRWLFISPTFFFGMVYSGALILWIYHVLVSSTYRVSEFAGTVLLAAIATGAKGTVVPPLLVALLVWLCAETAYRRRVRWPTLGLTLALGLGFAFTYFVVLADWGTGFATLEPFASARVSTFWQNHAASWGARLVEMGFSASVARLVSSIVCVGVGVIGYSGVSLLGWASFWHWKNHPNARLATWLGLSAAMYFLFGQLLSLDSNAQLYLLYPFALPQAVLAAGALVRLTGWLRLRVAEFGSRAVVFTRGTALLFFAAIVSVAVCTGALSWWFGILVVNAAALFVGPRGVAPSPAVGPGFGRFVWRVSPLIAIAALAAVQVNNWRLQTKEGFSLWIAQQPKSPDREVASLREAMDWVRTHTPRNAIFVANAFSEKNLRANATAVIDRTTVDKHYYYSALSERRFWVEGPTYLRNQYEALRRAHAASEVFYEGAPVSTLLSKTAISPSYILIDRSLHDGARVRLPGELCLFENARFSVYRIEIPRTHFESGLVSAEIP